MITEKINIYTEIVPFSKNIDCNVDEGVYIDIYFPEKKIRNGYSILAFPGGAYSFLSEKSGKEYGVWFASKGFTVFVLKFRLGSKGYDFKSICVDGYSAYNYVSSKCKEFKIDPQKIGLIGTSAGAHLAGIMSTGAGNDILKQHGVDQYTNLDIKPNFCVLCYGVLSLLNPIAHNETRKNFLGDYSDLYEYQEAFSPINYINENNPRSFLWHTAEDQEVTVDNTILYARELLKKSIPYELHIYQKGGHALGLAQHECLYWADDCARWIVDN
ncbi:alpha/beta hydrolase [Vreelandella neptunia]|uniref:Alpha/beta hydrolase n=1 Tax=Vreelandella neptunia TaxID=115551 RepID=A0ABS9SB30_9GAMM|nr:alpha/beta hydrolase [Halomonas neptunia]MCH4813328.1 alpha/beta hydrolase [Halomonas neptunia]